MKDQKLEDLRNHLLRGMGDEENFSTVTVNRLFKVMEEFATPEAFFCAKRSDIMKKWNQLSPDSKQGVGEGFFECFDEALSWWGDDKERAARRPGMPNPDLSREDITKIGDFMDMFSIQSMSLTEVFTLLAIASRGVEKPKESDEQPAR